ncbi:MAG TPA: MBL fold metallo-hydrolase [Steroidobacteraceae bacterium]|nr:MBL fold metallo-hydrolase [Steroidobacteraceae bacterium]
MKIRVFQSDKGDCLLLTSSSGKNRVLVDGGMSSSYTEHVAPALANLPGNDTRIDVVYVSHIDDDHISGVLKMLNDLMDWRVFDFQTKHKKAGDKPPKKPGSARPPEIGKIWHNAFHELLKDNAGAIGDMLAATTAVLSASKRPAGKAIFEQHSELALSKKQALQLVRRTGADQLAIPVNPEFGHKLMLLLKANPPKLKVGTMEFVVLGPSEADLSKLRDEWNQWLRENKETLADIRRKARADEELLTSDVDRLLAPLTHQAGSLVDSQIALAKKLGNRSKVTTPNLASLMFFVREGDRTLLLTGDGHADDVLKGLAQRNLLDAGGKLHVDVLKVPHHGAEFNMTAAFAQAVTADDYIFCGNGFASNPELKVIDLLVRERKKAFPQKAFTLWFNCTSALTQPAYRKHMRAVEKNVANHVTAGAGKVKARFVSGSFIDV